MAFCASALLHPTSAQAGSSSFLVGSRDRHRFTRAHSSSRPSLVTATRAVWSSHGREREMVILSEDSDGRGEVRGQELNEATETDGDGTESPTTSTLFYYDELRDATAALKRNVLAGKLLDSRLPVPNGEVRDTIRSSAEEGVCPGTEAGDESETSNLEVTHPRSYQTGLGKGKVPIESNGPPEAILHPYLSPDNLEGIRKEKLSPLPLPMPHKIRPLRLPTSSRRRRLGILPCRKDILKVHVRDFTRNLVEDIRGLPAQADVSQVLDKWTWELGKGSLARTVRELGHMEHIKVLQVLSWLQNHPHLWPDDTTLSAVLRVMVEAGEIEIASELQTTIGRHSAKAAQTLAAALAEIGMLGEAVEVLNHMKQSGWKIDGTVYTKLIRWARHTGGRGIVDSLLTDTDFAELNLTAHDYTSIMHSCSKLGLVDKVESVYLQFKSSGLKPNIVMFTVLLTALSREGKYREALSLFWDMEEAGCMPDMTAYQVMLDVCAKLGDLKRAGKVFKDLKDAGFQPTPEVYATLVHLHHKLGFKTTVEDLVTEMQSRGYDPSPQTLSCLSSSAAV